MQFGLLQLLAQNSMNKLLNVNHSEELIEMDYQIIDNKIMITIRHFSDAIREIFMVADNFSKNMIKSITIGNRSYGGKYLDEIKLGDSTIIPLKICEFGIPSNEILMLLYAYTKLELIIELEINLCTCKFYGMHVFYDTDTRNKILKEKHHMIQ